MAINLDEEMYLIEKAKNKVLNERGRQLEKWGPQRHSNEKWLAILVEEVGEAAQALQADLPSFKEGQDADDLVDEVTHLTAVGLAWLGQLLEERGEG